MQVLFLGIAAAAFRPPVARRADLSAYDPSAGVQVRQAGDRLVARWPLGDGGEGEMALSTDPAQPLILSMGAKRTILRGVDPTLSVTVGTRDLKIAGWTVFFDNPRQRPYETFPLTIRRDAIRVATEGGRTSVVLEGASAGPFAGEFRFTFYPGGRLVKAAAVMATARDATAYLYGAGLVASGPASWSSVRYTDLSNRLVPAGEGPLQARYRTILAEGPEGGTVAMVPPPHRYFYPLDFVDNMSTVWHHPDGFGVRQTVEGDKRWVPWVNAPPGTRQEMGVFYLLGDGDAAQTTREALAYTRNDRFKPLKGMKTFTSHYHVEHTIDVLRKRRDGKPVEAEPAFVRRFKAMGVDAVHLAEFHLGDDELKIADRLTRLKTLHEECARLSGPDFLLLPGEEPNVHLGGHWLSFFPRPVYWTLDRAAGQPFVEERPPFGKVYHVGSPDDVLRLMEAEDGLMWTAHPRIKGSTGFPEAYRDTAFFKSARFLGGAWKAMPTDYSLPRLGTRVLDLLDDLNNAGAHKQAPGEVDVFGIDERSELYAHMNVNYLRLARLPRFSDGWKPILDALRGGRFFTTTGEVLVPSCTFGGVASGGTVPARPTTLVASLEWTFPLAYAEVVSGDGMRVTRQRIELGDTRAFGRQTLRVPVDLRGKTWARFEVWDVATNGAYTQPVWVGT